MFKKLVIEYTNDYVYVVSEDPDGFFTEIFNKQVANGLESAELLKAYYEETYNAIVDLEELEDLNG